MKRWTRSMMCVGTLVVIGLTAAVALADDDDKRLNVSVAFGRGLNTAQPGNLVNHVIIPDEINIRQGGVVNFLLAGFHQITVYKPGTGPEDIVVPAAGTFINDLNNVFYMGILPAGGPPPGILPTDNPSNASNRSEPVGFPAALGTGTPPSPIAEPGVYLVICNVRNHFRDGMFAFIEVKKARGRHSD